MRVNTREGLIEIVFDESVPFKNKSSKQRQYI